MANLTMTNRKMNVWMAVALVFVCLTFCILTLIILCILSVRIYLYFLHFIVNVWVTYFYVYSLLCFCLLYSIFSFLLLCQYILNIRNPSQKWSRSWCYKWIQSELLNIWLVSLCCSTKNSAWTETSRRLTNSNTKCQNKWQHEYLHENFQMDHNLIYIHTHIQMPRQRKIYITENPCENFWCWLSNVEWLWKLCN